MSFCGATLRLQQTLSTIFPRSIRSYSLTSSSSSPSSTFPTHLSSSLLVSSIVRNPTSAAFMSSAAVSSSSSASSTSAGLRFREVILSSHSSSHPSLSTPSRPVAVLGTVNAYSALLAEQAGAKAIYLSGSGVATASHGLPDLGITDLHDVCEDAKRITAITKLPLLVDIDTGFGSAFNIARTIQELERVGVAAIHIEDQVQAKRCGHRPNKAIVPLDEMVDRIRAAVAARRDPNFVIMARTDALANEGLEKAIERAKAYIAAGADMLFPEACYTLEDYAAFRKALPQIPILANITEFGQTPLFTVEELGSVGVSMVLYPLSAFRAMSLAAQRVYESILKDGTQKNVLPLMQTRKDLYTAINYHSYENKLDALFGKEKEKEPKGKL